MPEKPFRAHVIAGGFPPGSHAGHDHDYARLRILEMLEAADIPCSVANDYADVEKWLATSRLMITYTAGPVLADPQNELVRKWLQSGGRWLALHGSSGGKAARVEGTSQRRMVRMAHHDTLGAFFINHPPVRRFQVDVPDRDHPLTRGLPEAFEVVDEPYMVEVLRPAESRILMSSALGRTPAASASCTRRTPRCSRTGGHAPSPGSATSATEASRIRPSGTATTPRPTCSPSWTEASTLRGRRHRRCASPGSNPRSRDC